MGNYEEAEKLYKRAIEGSEKVLGAEHPDTLRIVSNLGVLHHEDVANYWEEKYEKHVIHLYQKTEKLYKRALEGREKCLEQSIPTHLLV